MVPSDDGSGEVMIVVKIKVGTPGSFIGRGYWQEIGVGRTWE